MQHNSGKPEPKKETVTETRTAKVVVEKEIPAPMTQDEILAAEEIYDYDSKLNVVCSYFK